MRAIFKRVYSLQKSKQYDKAIEMIRQELKKRSTPDLKELEIVVLYSSKNYSATIEVAQEYLRTMRDNLQKSTICGFLSLISKESGKFDEEKKYCEARISINYKIVNDPKSKNWQVNLARLNLIEDYRYIGDLSTSLIIAEAMEKEFLQEPGDKRSMAPIYGELSRTYKAIADKARNLSQEKSSLQNNAKLKSHRKTVRSTVFSLVEKKQYDRALQLIREKIRRRSTPELKELEVWVLYSSENYSAVIEVGEKYLKRMADNFYKNGIANALVRTYKKLGQLDDENKYLEKAIEINCNIINNPNYQRRQLNKAQLNLITTQRYKGDLRNALKIARKMVRDFLKIMDDERELTPIYEELSNIYEAMAKKLFE